MKYMEINPLNRQLAEIEAKAKEQQQLGLGAEGAITQTEGTGTAVPQDLATQVKDVFGEETQITDKSQTVVDSASLPSNSNNADLNGDSTTASHNLQSTVPQVTAESSKIWFAVETIE